APARSLAATLARNFWTLVTVRSTSWTRNDRYCSAASSSDAARPGPAIDATRPIPKTATLRMAVRPQTRCCPKIGRSRSEESGCDFGRSPQHIKCIWFSRFRSQTTRAPGSYLNLRLAAEHADHDLPRG